MKGSDDRYPQHASYHRAHIMIRSPSRTSGSVMITLEIQKNGVTAHLTGRADYTATAGERQTHDYPGSPPEVEFTGFHAIECESCYNGTWNYADRDEWGGSAVVYDRIGLRHLQDDADVYADEALSDAADCDEDYDDRSREEKYGYDD